MPLRPTPLVHWNVGFIVRGIIHAPQKGESHLQHFHFLGMVLGKALYEGVLVDLPLAGFFLSKLLSRHNYVDDLPSVIVVTVASLHQH